MNLLITGIHGFVGSNLVTALKDRHSIYGLDIVSPSKDGVIKTFSWPELNDMPAMDIVIHLAGKAHDTKNKTGSQVYFDINTGLTRKIYDWYLTSEAKKFIFFSSVKAAADRVVGDVLTEDVVPSPKGPYGESKIAAENYILSKEEVRGKRQEVSKEEAESSRESVVGSRESGVGSRESVVVSTKTVVNSKEIVVNSKNQAADNNKSVVYSNELRDSRIESGNSSIKSGVNSKLPTTNSPLPTTHYPLPTTHYPLPTTDSSNKKTYILRPCMIHGPGNKGNLILLYNVIKKGIPYPLGAFENRRSFTSVDNLCFVISQLIEKDIASGIYNVGDDESLSSNELITLMANIMGKPDRIWKWNKSLIQLAAKIGTVLHLPLNTERLQKLTENYIVSNAKLKNALGIKNMPVRAEDGFRKTISSINN